MRRVWITYALGVVSASAAGFLFPLLGVSAFGFIPLSAGLIWAAYDLVEVAGGESASDAKRGARR